MSLAKILLCLDADPQPSVFDSIVALDADVDQLLRHADVKPDQVRDLVYGAMFTRGPKDLHNTAIFIGGRDVAAGEGLLQRATECFFGPLRVSVMLDANGSNTTAAAAVLAATKHVTLRDAVVTVLAATGPVGKRVVRLLAREGAHVRVASRKMRRAEDVCTELGRLVPDAHLTAWQTSDDSELRAALDEATAVIAAGAPGVELLPEAVRRDCQQLRVAIDLSAVPPAGIGGIDPQDKAQERDGQICYGAIGVGGTKMRIHKAAVQQLFETNDLVLDAEEIFAIGQRVVEE